MAEILTRRPGVLTAFLVEMARQPFQYGEWDCALTLARWVEQLTGSDPAPELRGHYRTRLGWVRIVNAAGGLVPLVGGLAERAGLVARPAPQVGDIAVVQSAAGPTGAIWVGTRWVAKTQAGVTGGPAEALAVWGI